MSETNKFDTLVESTLRNIYEMVAPAPASTQNPTQLNGIEQEAVAAAVNTGNQPVNGQPISPDQRRLADLAMKRQQQLDIAGRSAAQKLQKAVTSPQQQPVVQPSMGYNQINPTNR